MTDQQNLQSALRSHFPIIVIETHEETRALQLIRTITKGNAYGLLYWTAGEGLRAPLFSGHTMSIEGGTSSSRASGNLSDNETTDPEVMLRKVRDDYARSVVVLVDFHPYLTNPTILRLTKEIALAYENRQTQLILISHSLDIPAEIKRLCMRFELSLPDAGEIRKIMVEEARAWSSDIANPRVKADKGAMEKLVNNMLGLTASDARRFIRNAIHDDGAITHSDVKEVMAAKYELVSQTGALSFEYDTADFADVGGFRVLKQWLERRKRFFLEAEGQADIPRGVLLLGVQGCGKSLASKAVAGVWGVPLLRLDTGALYNKYIGETEKNIRTALKTAETLAPCVLWIDEIEKGIDAQGDDNGTSRRLLGTLLTWMAENTKRVFLVATANNIQSLPPELIRKGRMDEIFFVDLPDQDTREDILRLHLHKRELDPENFDIRAVAEKCEGFSGAELEQVVVSARYAAHADAGPLNTTHLMEEVALTRPLSVVMAEEIARLRDWARDRTVSVD